MSSYLSHFFASSCPSMTGILFGYRLGESARSEKEGEELRGDRYQRRIFTKIEDNMHWNWCEHNATSAVTRCITLHKTFRLHPCDAKRLCKVGHCTDAYMSAFVVLCLYDTTARSTKILIFSVMRPQIISQQYHTTHNTDLS